MAIFYDERDHELLRMVNRFLGKAGEEAQETTYLLDPRLHPHGIKELAIASEISIAYAVINLLHSLQEGDDPTSAAERLHALQALHEEVLYSANSTFRRNTGRVLVQIMKELSRSSDNPEKQLSLAHDFRQAASGRPRIIRQLLKRYYLLEMPEEWDQLTFDNHVHDANTKGRKNPTHRILDAWIKGVRSLMVIYYNYVEPQAVQELLEAAKIMHLNVRIGIEYKVRFRDKYICFIWEPYGFPDYQAMLSFLNEQPTMHLMQEGRKVSHALTGYILHILDYYNSDLRISLADTFTLQLDPISEEDFFSFVGAGQASLLHLSDKIHKKILTAFQATLPELQQQYAVADPATQQAVRERMQRMNTLTPEDILHGWLTPQRLPHIASPYSPDYKEQLPSLLRMSPYGFMDWLMSLHAACRITLTLSELTAEDVLEIVYDTQGLVSHLELFNLKDVSSGKAPHLEAINALQLAINSNNPITLKRIILRMLQAIPTENAHPDELERADKLKDILLHMPRLLAYYRTVPLKSRIGSDSTSRSHAMYGMGFVFPATLPSRAQKELRSPKDTMRRTIPLQTDTYSRYTYSTPAAQDNSKIVSVLRKLPFLENFGSEVRHDWITRTASTHYTQAGNIATLGGMQRDATNNIHIDPQKCHYTPNLPRFSYLNTNMRNTLKVLAGFIPAALTFWYTQQWWVLAYFGAVIWFSITGFRNILQSVLGGGGIRRSPLLRWNAFVSWERLCDSLMYTGISVPLLELLLRSILLEQVMGVSSATDPLLTFSVMAVANSLYICSHNLYRGLPRGAILGNMFRSIIAIPVALLYNTLLVHSMEFFGLAASLIYVQQGAAIISKAASDTVAGIIEGLADRTTNMRMRKWDYEAKMQQLMHCYVQLELLFPEEDILDIIRRSKVFMPKSGGVEARELEKSLIITTLDLLYFWHYQPRARSILARLLQKMTEEEQIIFVRSQEILLRKQEVAQFFVDGIVGQNFPRALAFYLEHVQSYLHAMSRLTGVPLQEER